MLPPGIVSFIVIALSISTPSASTSLLQLIFTSPPPPPTSSISDSALFRFTFNNSSTAKLALDHLHYSALNPDLWHFHSSASQFDIRLPSPLPIDSLWDNNHSHLKPISSQSLIPSISHYLDQQPSLSAFSDAAVTNFTSSSSPLSLSPNPEDYEIHNSYHPYDNLVTIMHGFANQFPNFTKVVNLGNTSEGREIIGLTVTNFSYLPEERWRMEEAEEEVEDEVEAESAVDEHDIKDVDHEDFVIERKKKRKGKKGHAHKLGVVIVGSQHAREWISTSTSLYFMHALLLSTLPDSEDDDTLELLKTMSFTFIPVVNVDGYVFSWEHDRLWRKNRQPSSDDPDEKCVGIDINRNWASHWAKGTRPNPCSDSHPGSKPFEALEIQALSAFMLEPEHHVVSFIDLHSYGQMLMYPFSFSCEKSSADEEDQFEAVIGAAKALKEVHGREFETGSVCGVSLSGPGDAIDWSYSKAKIRWSFTFELRDQGVFGFLLPASQIIPSGEETSAALLSLADFVNRREQGNKFR